MPTFVLDLEGRVILWNDACANLTGLAAAQVMGTREHWRGFYREARPCLADVVLNSSQPGQAEQSDAVVKEAVSAMSEIESSSRQISQIIGVIDEIAFQTNLLALNAGVEAARAGDAGRGFAVVASEVRALAQRSAEAAKEIKTLISASTQQVSQGVDRVGETGRALTHIADQVNRIESVVVEIAASAQEQAAGLNDVNASVNQMDQVTQQNAAMVEQTTTVSHKLNEESEALAGLIAAFELGHAATARFATPSPPSPRATKSAAPPRRQVASAGRASAAVAIEAPADAGWDEF